MRLGIRTPSAPRRAVASPASRRTVHAGRCIGSAAVPHDFTGVYEHLPRLLTASERDHDERTYQDPPFYVPFPSAQGLSALFIPAKLIASNKISRVRSSTSAASSSSEGALPSPTAAPQTRRRRTWLRTRLAIVQGPIGLGVVFRSVFLAACAPGGCAYPTRRHWRSSLRLRPS